MILSPFIRSAVAKMCTGRILFIALPINSRSLVSILVSCIQITESRRASQARVKTLFSPVHPTKRVPRSGTYLRNAPWQEEFYFLPFPIVADSTEHIPLLIAVWSDRIRYLHSLASCLLLSRMYCQGEASLVPRLLCLPWQKMSHEMKNTALISPALYQRYKCFFIFTIQRNTRERELLWQPTRMYTRLSI